MHALECVIMILSKDSRPPLMASFDITYRCNIKCRMCNVWKITRKEKELDLREWKSVVDQLTETFSIKLFRLLGGEPFLSPCFEGIVHHIKANDCRLIIITNGTLIDREMARFLVSERVDHIRVSLNGLQKTDDFYRGKGTFSKTMKGIRTIINEKELQGVQEPKIEVHPLVSKVNCEEIPKLLLLSRELGTDFNFHYLTGNIAARVQDPGFPEDSRKTSVMCLHEKKHFEKSLPSLVSLRERFLRVCFSKIRRLLISRDCWRNAYHFGIDPWGYVRPCEFLYDHSYGNSREEDIREIWYSKKRADLRHHIARGNLPICQVCGRRNFLPYTVLSKILPLSRLNVMHARGHLAERT